MRKELGVLKITNGQIDITDPCYDDDVWCRKTIKSVQNGDYNVVIDLFDEGEWGIRVGELEIEHELGKNVAWSSVTFEIGVDAGLCGFFVDKPNYNDDEWSKVCEWLNNETNGYQNPVQFIVDNNTPFKCNGVVASSGYGDGCYSCYVKLAKGNVVGLKLVFIEKEEDEDE